METQLNKLFSCVEKVTKVSKKDLLSKKKSKECIDPRYAFIDICFHVLKMSKAQIGYVLERNHSSVIYALTEIPTKLEQDITFATMREEILNAYLLYDQTCLYVPEFIKFEVMFTKDEIIEYLTANKIELFNETKEHSRRITHGQDEYYNQHYCVGIVNGKKENAPTIFTNLIKSKLLAL